MIHFVRRVAADGVGRTRFRFSKRTILSSDRSVRRDKLSKRAVSSANFSARSSGSWGGGGLMLLERVVVAAGTGAIGRGGVRSSLWGGVLWGSRAMAFRAGALTMRQKPRPACSTPERSRGMARITERSETSRASAIWLWVSSKSSPCGRWEASSRMWWAIFRTVAVYVAWVRVRGRVFFLAFMASKVRSLFRWRLRRRTLGACEPRKGQLDVSSRELHDTDMTPP